MKLKSTANLLSVIGVLLLIGGAFFLFGKFVNLVQYRQMTDSWSDQVYEQTYGSGYKHGSVAKGEVLNINLEVDPNDIRYDMYIVSNVDKVFVPLGIVFGSIVIGLLTLVIGCYLSGKAIALEREPVVKYPDSTPRIADKDL